MKKKVIAAVCIVLAAVLIAGGTVAAIKLPHPLNYDIDSVKPVGSSVVQCQWTQDRVTVRLEEKDTVKILCFTDIHLDGNNKTSIITVTNMVDAITKEKPDLVLFGGDMITSGLNRKRAAQFCEIFENLGVYWGGTLGNHEGDNGLSISRPEMIDLFSSYEHCLMRRGSDEIWGDCTYALDILNADGTLCRTFYFFDTGDEVSEETKEKYGIPADESPYDGVKEDQVAWYEKAVAETKELYGEESKSVIMLHIPLPQYQQGFDNGAELLYGEKRENICESGFDSGLFKAIKDGGSTQAVFCGHDHLNDFGFMFDGVLLSYLQPSGYGSYTVEKLGYEEKDWLQGYTVLTFTADGEMNRSAHRYSEDMQ